MKKAVERTTISMRDNYSREINYLRVSLTERCNLNCVYCGNNSCFSNNELTCEQIIKLVGAFAKCGVTKVRLTGGEPLVRNDICRIVSGIRSIDDIKKIVLTTNGILLKKYAKELKQAGLDAVNISLDSTDEKIYKKMTGSDNIKRVFDGIEEAQNVGLSPVRINAVLIKGLNDLSARDLIELASGNEIDVRFIELMPFSDIGENKRLIVTGEEILSQFPFLKPIENGNKSNAARYYYAEGYKGKIGFITPVSNRFCENCNRIRLLSNGSVKPCLAYDSTVNLVPYIDDEELLIEKIKTAVLSKPKGHNFDCGYGGFHGMNKIGG